MSRKYQKQVFTRVFIMVTILALAVMALWVAHAGAGQKGAGKSVPRIAPPHSTAYGKTLTEWNTIYWRWMFEGGESKVGRVQLMPLPAGAPIGGAGTEEDPVVLTGELEITLELGTPFVLPLFAWLGERYEGYPDDPDDEPFPDDEFLEWIHPELTIDGRTIMSDDNKAAFYVPPTPFDPPIDYPEPSEYGSIAAIWFQGIGIVSPPLPVGEHVIHLSEPFFIRIGDWEYYGEYDNTWTVTVAPEKKGE